MTTSYCYDIETRGVAKLAERMWAPEEYRVPGNIKDPVKLADHKAAWHNNQAEAKAKFIQKAALSPLTGEIVVIGLSNDSGDVTTIEGPEEHIIRSFWQHVEIGGTQGTKFYNWSGRGAYSVNFDLDFIVTRSRILGIKVPMIVRSGRFYGPQFVDLAKEFLLYQNDAYLSLSAAAELCGLFEQGVLLKDGTSPRPKLPTDKIQGANFAHFYDLGAKDREDALDYLSNDLALLHCLKLHML